MKRALVVALTLAGCAPEIGDAAPWVEWDEVTGELRPEASLDGAPLVSVGDSLRIVTFNVELGQDTEALAALFRDHPMLATTDVLMTQEIESHADEGPSRAAALAVALSWNYVYAPARLVDGGTHGLAIFSRHRITAAQVMKLPRVDMHIRPRERIALAVDLDLDGRELRVVDLHLDTRLNATQRILQLRPAVLDEPGPVVIGGDLNTNPYAWVQGAVPLTSVRALSGLEQAEIIDDYMRAIGYASPTEDAGPTQDAVIEQLRLDSLYTRELVPGDSGVVGDTAVSDHQPLWLDLPWPPP